MRFFEVGIFDFYSEKLCNALGITKDSIPPYISRMKKLGYPPGYQIHHHDKQNFVLALYGNYLSYVPGLCDSVFFFLQMIVIVVQQALKILTVSSISHCLPIIYFIPIQA